MEENMVNEVVTETAEDAVAEATELMAMPEEAITDVPTIDVSEPTLGIGKVILVASVAAAATYGAYKGIGKALRWAKGKIKERKYAHLKGHYKGADEVTEDDFVDEDLDDVTEVEETEENVEA